MVEQSDDRIVNIITQSNMFFQKIVKYLKSPLEEESSEAIRLTGTILSADDNNSIDIFIFNDGINGLACHLNNQTSPLKIKEILWALSNIAAGTDE